VVVPVPETIEPELDEDEEAAGGAAAAAEAVAAGGGAAAEEAVPPVMAPAVPVPFCAIAICWNMAWVLLAVGLMEKVIPFPQ
jgi:hypothetical protein